MTLFDAMTDKFQSTGWPVDGHVHLHKPALVGKTLTAALANFQRVSGKERGLLGGLLLTQAAGERVFEHLQSVDTLDDWQFVAAAAEPQSLIARHGDATVAVICGRQVRARGGLEVLALGTCREFEDGRPFENTLSDVMASDALPVLPWGFGKWLGARGEAVRRALRSAGARTVLMGDNGSRLALWPTPELIEQFARQGFKVVPGTDPFPFGRDYRRVGGFGFFTPTIVDESAPWRSIRSGLDSQKLSPKSFGRACGPLRFAFNQVGIQIYNRFFRSAVQ